MCSALKRDKSIHIIGNRTYVIEFEKALILMDPGFDCARISWKEALKKEGNTVYNLVGLVEKIKKPLTHVFVSHNHYDHLDNLNILLGLRYNFKNMDFTVVSHENSHIPAMLHTAGLPFINIKKDTVLTISGRKVKILCTPGHTDSYHDICVYIPFDKILFCGDMAQPQGPSYENCDFMTPFSNHAIPEIAVESLKKLEKIKFNTLLMGHDGVVLKKVAGQNALALTRRVLERTFELAGKLVLENPQIDQQTIEEWIFDTISWERGVSKKSSEERKSNGLNGPCSYMGEDSCYALFDRPSIRGFVSEFF